MLVLVLPVALIVRGALDPALLLLPLSWCCSSPGARPVAAVAVLHAHFRDVEPVLAPRCCRGSSSRRSSCPWRTFRGSGSRAWLGDLLEWGNPVAPFVTRCGRACRRARRPSPRTCCTSARAGACGAGGGARSLPADGARPGGDAVTRPGEVVARERHPLVPRPQRRSPHAEGARRAPRAAGVGDQRARAARRWACGWSRGRRWASSGETAPARPRRCAALRGSCRSTRAGPSAAGGWSRCSSWARGSAQDFSGRENIYLNGALHGFEQRGDRGAGRADRRVLRARRVHRRAGEGLQLGHVPAARVLDRRAPRRRRDADRRDPRGGRRVLPAQVPASGSSERWRPGATMVLVSHDPSAIERVCRRVVVLDDGRVVFDGEVADGPPRLPPPARRAGGRLAQRAARGDRRARGDRARAARRRVAAAEHVPARGRRCA